ncbi:MAG: tetratricopeptide repeat protein [Acidimicrobiales bacterium]
MSDNEVGDPPRRRDNEDGPSGNKRLTRAIFYEGLINGIGSVLGSALTWFVFVLIGAVGIGALLAPDDDHSDPLPPPPASPEFEPSRLLLEEGRHEEAVDQVNQEMRENGRTPEALVARGYAYLMGEKTDRAYDDFDGAIKLDDKCFEAYYFRGVVEKRHGKHDKAVRDFTEALRLNAYFVDSYYQRAVTLGRLGDGESAYDDLLAFEKLAKPDNRFYASAQVLIARLKRMNDRENVDEVKEVFDDN